MNSVRYSYRYITASRFLPEVEYHFFKLRMVPCECDCQHILEQQLTVTPHCALRGAHDGLGNLVQYGGYSTPHSQFQVESRGVVECSDYVIREDSPSPIWLCQSPLTGYDAALRTWAKDALAQAQCDTHSIINAATVLMHAVHHHITYERFATHNGTTAIEVYNQRCGVCQDYAHLMITACRACGIPARYVNGLVVGEGETHAWVEVYDGSAWRGFDPTHNHIITTGYIRLAHGRDVSDCPSNRGRFYGWTSEVLQVQTEVKTI